MSLQEWRGFLEALDLGLHGCSLLRFYHLGRACLIKSETYFDAYDRRQVDQPTSASWRVAFDAATKSKYLVLQQLLVGMNAHINLDLGIAAAETCPQKIGMGFGGIVNA